MKIAVCDDEKSMIEKLKQDILSYSKEYRIDCFESGELLTRSDEKYDIIFLDIDMDGMNGIEAARKIREKDKNVKIIYVTSYADYVNYAFSVHAFSYLLKPVKTEEIHRQLKEADSYYKEENQSKILQFETKEGSIRQDICDIYYLEYLNRHVVMKTSQGEHILTGGINENAERMKLYGFAVPHKSFCVNLYHVRNVKGYDIYMTSGDIIPLSQKKSVEFRRELHEFLAKLI